MQAMPNYINTSLEEHTAAIGYSRFKLEWKFIKHRILSEGRFQKKLMSLHYSTGVIHSHAPHRPEVHQLREHRSILH